MSNIAIQKAEDQTRKTLRVFEQIEEQTENVRRRAFELFESRGCEAGRELEDWLQAEREVLNSPAAELAESAQEYDIRVTLAGFDSKDVQVTASPFEIIVHAKTKSEQKEDSEIVWTEFGSKDVYRRFEVPVSIDPDRVRATLDRGILRIFAAKAPKQQPVAAATA